MTFANAMDVCDLVHICYHSKLRAHTQKHSRELCLFLFSMLQHRSFSKEWLLHAWEYHFVCIFCSCWCWFYSLSVLFHSLVRSLSLLYSFDVMLFVFPIVTLTVLVAVVVASMFIHFVLYSVFISKHTPKVEWKANDAERNPQPKHWLTGWMDGSSKHHIIILYSSHDIKHIQCIVSLLGIVVCRMHKA